MLEKVILTSIVMMNDCGLWMLKGNPQLNHLTVLYMTTILAWFPGVSSGISWSHRKFLFFAGWLLKSVTMDKLQNRRQIIVNGGPSCLAEEETASHLLLHCNLAPRVWATILLRFGISWVMHLCQELSKSYMLNGGLKAAQVRKELCALYHYLQDYG